MTECNERSFLLGLPETHFEHIDLPIPSEPRDTTLCRKTSHVFHRYCCAIVAISLLAFAFIFSLGRLRPVNTARSNTAKSASPVTETGTVGNRSLTLRFFSLNTFIRPYLVGVGDFKDERLHDLEKRIANYDVACFQELFWTTGPRKAEFLDSLKNKYGLDHIVSIPVPGFCGLAWFPPKIIDGGLVIASRFPIVQTHYITFRKASFKSIDILVAKGVLYARLAVFQEEPTRYLHVFTTHLQANNGLEGVPFDEIRRNQLQQAISFIQKMVADDPAGPIILAGDFNINGRNGFSDASSSEEYKRAISILRLIRPSTPLRDIIYEAYNNSHPVSSTGGLHGDNQKNERLDYIFMSSPDIVVNTTRFQIEPILESAQVNELRVENRSYHTLSDHCAVEAKFVLSESPVY